MPTQPKKTVTASSKVSLREINADTVRTICSMDVAESQKGFVAPNAVSIAQAYFEPKAWFRAIYADETPIGFVMLFDDAEKPEYFLWRFMIAENYQGLGFGRSAIELLEEYVRSRPNATELLVSYVPEDGGPGPFYTNCGFTQTGKMHGIEVEMVKKL